MRIASTSIVSLAVFALGCATARAPAGEDAAEQSPRGAPLAAMAGRSVLVLPVQRNVVVVDQTLDQAAAIEGWNFLVGLDDSIASALSARGLGSTWTFAQAITAAARRNGGLVADPHVLAAGSLRRLVKASDSPLNEPLPTQIRSLVALRDGRYVILPAAVRFAGQPAATRGTLIVYLIDSRTARIAWSGEVASDTSPRFSPAMAGSIAERLADLVVAR
jgi:hypothetical protein